ncbi:hypothetical protein Tco_1530361 [Tanacetum coccineum]
MQQPPDMILRKLQFLNRPMKDARLDQYSTTNSVNTEFEETEVIAESYPMVEVLGKDRVQSGDVIAIDKILQWTSALDQAQDTSHNTSPSSQANDKEMACSLVNDHNLLENTIINVESVTDPKDGSGCGDVYDGGGGSSGGLRQMILVDPGSRNYMVVEVHQKFSLS